MSDQNIIDEYPLYVKIIIVYAICTTLYIIYLKQHPLIQTITKVLKTPTTGNQMIVNTTPSITESITTISSNKLDPNIISIEISESPSFLDGIITSVSSIFSSTASTNISQKIII
jgi:hypothetical protein